MARLVGALMLVGVVGACSDSSDRSDANGPASERLETADERWAPDLNADGAEDAMIRVGKEVSFAVAEGDDLVDVIDADGDPVVVALDDDTTVTCQEEGAFVQTFEPPAEDSLIGSLRLARLDVDGSTGVLTPSPSFHFGPDFKLPVLGHGCPPAG